MFYSGRGFRHKRRAKAPSLLLKSHKGDESDDGEPGDFVVKQTGTVVAQIRRTQCRSDRSFHRTMSTL